MGQIKGATMSLNPDTHDLTELSMELLKTQLEIDSINDSLKDLKSKKAGLETQLLDQMESMGNNLNQIRTAAGTVSILESKVGNVKDWDAFYRYIHDHNAFHLLNKAPKHAALRELWDLEQEIPGVEPFTKRSIGLRKAK